MNATGSPTASAAPRKASGRRSLSIPSFREKLDYLLARMGRQNQWLTQVLVSPDGSHPSAQSISNWKDSGSLPHDYLVSFRFAFGIDEALLMSPDLATFRAAADAAMLPGSGRFWKTLLEGAVQGPTALSLVVDGAAEPRRRLRNLGFGRPAPSASPLVQSASFEDGVRFSIPASYLGRISKSGETADPISLVLCCEDKLGWKTITPSRHHPGFEPDGERWLFPGPGRDPLYFHETVGNYRAVVVAVAALLPPAIESALRADKTVWGTDALAAWLFEAKPAHLVMDRPFLVTTPRR